MKEVHLSGHKTRGGVILKDITIQREYAESNICGRLITIPLANCTIDFLIPNPDQEYKRLDIFPLSKIEITLLTVAKTMHGLRLYGYYTKARGHKVI